jgi:CheY-like chemotaxis protein
MAKILVVEDDTMNLEIATRILRMFKHEVVSAVDASRGVALATSEKPDLVLMDLRLPEPEDGLEATRQIRAQPETESVPIIALTSYGMPRDIERARQAGCDDFVCKPVHNWSAVLAKMTRLLRQREVS